MSAASFIRPHYGTMIDRSGTIAAGGTSQALMVANSDRKYFIFQNNSSGDLWINGTIAAILGQPSMRIQSSQSYVLESSVISIEAWSVIGATTGQAFTCKEL